MAPGRAASVGSVPAPESPGDACLSDPECKQLVDHGRALSEATQFEAALVAYQSAYARKDVPWLLVNIGRMRQKLGRHEEALNAYEQFLKTQLGQADPVLRGRVVGYLAEAENTVTEQKKKTAAEQQRLAGEQQRLTSMKVSLISEQDRLASERNLLVAEKGRLAATTKPIYKRWWFWTLLGGATAAVITTAAVSASLAATAREPDYVSSLPQFRPFQ